MFELSPLRESVPIVAVIGGAVAGSEAARLLAERGVVVLVIEQGARPYGKIEGGLPRWHRKLREAEYRRIDKALDHPNIFLLTETRLGEDVSIEQLIDELKLSAVILANGAWRDRPLPIEGIETYRGRGLIYQNEVVQWFNHHESPDYQGPEFHIDDGALVVGGGLASIDVAKLANFEVVKRALKARGEDVDIEELEIRGVPEILARYDLSPASIGMKGSILVYRRRMEDMPLAAPRDDSPKALARAEKARVKIMTRVMEKYLVRFEELLSPIEAIDEGGALRGLRFQRNRVEDGKLSAIPGEIVSIRAPLVLSSIGSIPEPIPGIPRRGELYDFADWETGEIRGLPRVYGLGNVLTGKGNIKHSRANSSTIAAEIAEVLTSGEGEADTSNKRAEIAEQAEKIADQALPRALNDPRDRKRVEAFIKERQLASRASGDYRSMVEESSSP